MAFTSAYIGTLRERIQDSMITSISERSFLPSDKLHEIFTLDAIKGAIAELTCGPEDGIKLVDTIHGQGKRVFAILIYNNWHDLIIEFRKHDALDSRLPLSENDAEAIAGRSIGLRFAREAQWAFCPYVFPEKMYESHRRVERKTILPFIGSERIGSGGFSAVHKMSVSPSQQNFVDQKAVVVHVVQKKLNAECSREDFEREDRNLRLLNQLQHPNIIPLWGSYTYREEYNFLFPYIDMDLGRFLMAEARYLEFQWDFTFYSALAGLASALSKTHSLHLNSANHDVDFEAIGYHHDLRPPNVLVCADNFILSDFGLGRLRGAHETSHTPYKSNTGDYNAPESTDMNENPQTVNRAIDVWAFGCLIAEVVTYMLKGATGVREFRALRLKPGRFPNWKDASFYQPRGDVKNEVIDWMEALRRDNPHPDLIPRLIKVSLDALEPNPQTRPNMKTIYQQLETLSREKHLNAVQTAFCEVQGNDVESASVAQHHQGFRFANERLQVWGHALAADKGDSFASFVELSERCVITMKTLFCLLREELSKRSLGCDSNLSLPLQNLIVQNVENLWRLLPDDLVSVAEENWKEELAKRGLSQQISSPQDIPHVSLPAVQPSAPPTALQSEFEEAARSFRDSLVGSVNFDEISNITSIADVYDFTDKLQAEQHKDGGLRNLPKINIYLERLEGYATNIDFVIRGNHNILALIWGPIVLLLQWSRVLDKAYDSLIDAIATIGQIIPDFRSSISASNRSQETMEITVLFFKDILNFYRETLQLFARPNWTHIFDGLWPKHHASVVEISHHIERLTRLMRTEIRMENIQQEHEFRKHAMDSFKAQRTEAHRQEYYRIMTSFNPRRYDDTLYRLHGLRCQQTGVWLFTFRPFIDWVQSSDANTQILWLKGIPGAGKTVLSSAIIDRLRIIQTAKTAFAFLTYQDASTLALSTIHSIIFQLAGKDEDLIAIICESMCDDLKSNLSTAGNLLASLIRYSGPVYLVIDGVDEISEVERGRLIIELLRLVEECEMLKIIFSSRSEADLMRLLSDIVIEINVHDQNEGNIRSYIDGRIQNIFRVRRVFPKAQVVIKELLEPLASRAKGMFLYARLIMDMVASLQDLSEIQKELTVLPENLDAAYHRIIVRLGEHKDKPTAEQARRLLGWIACTPNLITIEEAQQALLVRRGDKDQVFNIVAKLSVIEFLGPIVEVVDTYIRFVHFTAKEYICSPHLGAKLINTTQATLDLAVQCIEYLCQRHHDPQTGNECSHKVCTGQYSLHAFSTRMWFDLVCQYFRLTEGKYPPKILVDSIAKLHKSRKTPDFPATLHIVRETTDESDDETGNKDGSSNGDGGESEVGFETLKPNEPLLYQMLCSVSKFRNLSSVFTGKTIQDSRKDIGDPLSISRMSQCIRQAFDGILCDSPKGRTILGKSICHERCSTILEYYGPRPFKCRFTQCEFWLYGFNTRIARDKHERSHDKPLKCDISGCEFGLIGFLSEKMRQDHIKTAHRSDSLNLSVEIQALPDDGVEAMLSSLVQENQVEAVKKILFHFPNALQNHDTRQKLQLIAAFQASEAILKLLEGPDERSDILSELRRECIVGSISSCNESTLRYLLSRLSPLHSEINRQVVILRELMSKDWHAGTEVYVKWFQKSLHLFPESGGSLTRLKIIFNAKSIISAAASHPSGSQQLLFLWSSLGLISRFGKRWASTALKRVAEVGSIPLAIYLLRQGVDVDCRNRSDSLTALHHAVIITTVEAAEMVRFLLLNGANPDADGPRHSRNRICEEEGAKNIHRYLGMTWDELIEDTKRIRSNREAERQIIFDTEN
ncbi:hypothetical protein F4680DRAFT_203534 [Xylaria scruposa]|nr:hypothetical protein F4680DRAFT_203534 [Xylaria scruposa]